MGEYEGMTLEELKDEAREQGIEGFSTMRKAELVAALDAGSTEPAEEGESPVETMEVETATGTVQAEVGVDGENPVSADNPPAKAVIRTFEEAQEERSEAKVEQEERTQEAEKS